MGRQVLRVALAALLLLGALGLARQLDRNDPWSRRVVPSGSFWELREDGEALSTISQRDPGLTLQPGQELVTTTLAGPGADASAGPGSTPDAGPDALGVTPRHAGAPAPLAAAPTRIGVSAVRPSGPAALVLSLPLPGQRALLARVWPAEPYRVELAERAADGSLATLATGVGSIPRPDGPAAARGHEIFAHLSKYSGFQLALQLRGRRVDLSLAGVSLASASLDAAPTGPPTLWTQGGPMTLLSLSLHTGTQPAALPGIPATRPPPSQTESFEHLPRPARGLLPRVAPALALLACAALVLAAICRVRPSPLALTDATAMLLAPAAAVLASTLQTQLSHLSLLLGGALLAGLPPSLLRLRSAGLLPSADDPSAPGGGETSGRSARRMVVAGMAAVFCVTTIAERRLEVLSPLLRAEAAARLADPPPAPDLPDDVTLDRNSALVILGPFRDLELNATITLGPGAILELRARAPDVDVARGQALFVPADDVPGPASATSAGMRWIWEEAGLFAPMGEPGPRLPPGQTTALRVACEGRVLSAWIGERALVGPEPDGELRPWRANRPHARTASLRLPAGHLVLLAARGEVRVQGLSVVPQPPSPSPDPAPTAWRTSALPLLAALALGFIAMHLLGLSLGAALESQLLALLPLPLALLAFSRQGALEPQLLLSAVVASVVLAALPALLASGAGLVRRLALVLLAALCLPAALSATVEQPVPLDGRTVNALAYTDTHAEALAAERLHLEHPLFRRWNGWLASHAFRGRRPDPSPPASSQRVLVLGGSSTWGYHLPEQGGLDWPTRLGRALTSPERPVEVLNAAWPAATGHHITAFLEHELISLQPDLIVICLRYNDSFALARSDEQAWLSRRLEQGEPWSPWDARRDRTAELRARRAFALGLLAGERSGRPQAAPWPDERTPPDLFAELLGHMIDVSEDVQADVLLVVEPLAPDSSVAWADELADAMKQVAERRSVALFDARDALRGGPGEALFMDVVHLTAEGHRVMAEALLEPLDALLATRR